MYLLGPGRGNGDQASGEQQETHVVLRNQIGDVLRTAAASNALDNQRWMQSGSCAVRMELLSTQCSSLKNSGSLAKINLEMRRVVSVGWSAIHLQPITSPLFNLFATANLEIPPNGVLWV